MSLAEFGSGAAVALALILARAAWHKLRHRPHYAARIADHELVPAAVAAVLPLPLALLEIGCAVALLMPYSRAPGAVASAVVFSIYALAMGINLLRGRGGIDCGCGPVALRQPLSAGHVLRNAVMIALAVLVVRIGSAVPDAPPGWLRAALLLFAYRACDLLLSREALLADD